MHYAMKMDVEVQLHALLTSAINYVWLLQSRGNFIEAN
jgi:hypothetical protein